MSRASLFRFFSAALILLCANTGQSFAADGDTRVARPTSPGDPQIMSPAVPPNNGSGVVLNGYAGTNGISTGATISGFVGSANPNLDPTQMGPLSAAARHEEFKARTGLDHVNLVLAFDTSGVSAATITTGSLQMLLNRLCPMLLDMTGEQSIDTWLYSEKVKHSAPITRSNLSSWVADNITYKMYLGIAGPIRPPETIPASEFQKPYYSLPNLGSGKREDLAMINILNSYDGAKKPTFAMFLSDSPIDAKSVQILKENLEVPVFWQFVSYSDTIRSAIMDQYDIQHNMKYGTMELLKPPKNLMGLGPGLVLARAFHADRCEGTMADLISQHQELNNLDGCSMDYFPFESDRQFLSKLLVRFPAWAENAKRLGASGLPSVSGDVAQ